MDNRERDSVSKRTSPTDAGELNRKTSERSGRSQSGNTAEFGQKIGRSDNLEEERMDNDRKHRSDESVETEPNRQSGTGSRSSQSGRSGSVGSSGNIGSSSGIRRDEEMENDVSSGRRGSSGSLGNTGSSGSRGDSSSGRH